MAWWRDGSGFEENGTTTARDRLLSRRLGGARLIGCRDVFIPTSTLHAGARLAYFTRVYKASTDKQKYKYINLHHVLIPWLQEKSPRNAPRTEEPLGRNLEGVACRVPAVPALNTSTRVAVIFIGFPNKTLNENQKLFQQIC